MKSEEALSKLLPAYEGYYTVKKEDVTTMLSPLSRHFFQKITN